MDEKVVTIQAGIGAVHLVIVAENKFFLVDTGTPGKEQKIIKAMTSRGLNPYDLSFIFLTHTHYDHAGSAAQLKKLTGAKVIVHALEAGKLSSGYSGTPNGTNPLFKGISYLGKKFKNPSNVYEPVDPDVVFEKKLLLSDFGFDGYIMHTPGHTSGSSSLVSGTKAFVGDTIFHWGRYIYPPFANEELSVLESWKDLLNLNINTYYPAHGKPLRKSKLLEVYSKVSRKM